MKINKRKDNEMNLDKSIEYYYSDIQSVVGEKFVTKATIEIIKKSIKNKNILNLGLGNGVTSRIFDVEVNSQMVIEGSREILEKFSFDSNKTTFIESYFENYNSDRKYNIVLANHVLEHVDDPVTLMKNKFHKWLTDDGVAFITVPNAKSIHRLIGKQMGMLKNEYDLNNSDEKAGHQRVYDIDILRNHIEKANLEIIEIGGYNIKMVSLVQMKDWSQELLDAIFEVSKKMPHEICANIWVKVKKRK
jgi:2-polyprenyl-3-methyl-5-hydroxy-6-metoxy-1,4-benzoquinol methylase